MSGTEAGLIREERGAMMMAHDGRPYAAGWANERKSARGAAGEQATQRTARPAGSESDARDTAYWVMPPAGGSRAPASLRRLMRALLDGCVIGGVTLAPVLSVLGCVGLILPAHTVLHQLATALLYAAVVWLFFSLSAAHLCSNKSTAQDRGRASHAQRRADDDSGVA